METLLCRIRRRFLIVGWATGLVAAWHLLSGFLWGQIPGWRPLFALYCLGGTLLMLLSARRLRKGEAALKAVENDCWGTAALCAVMGVWFAAKLLFHFGDPDDMMAGFLGVTVAWSHQAYRKIEKTICAQREARA